MRTDRVPTPAQALVVLAVAAGMPFVLNSGDLFGYGLFTLLYALLGLGLNVVVVVLVVVIALWSLLRSRTGRAWQALREDPLAAEMMGTPVNRLKIVAFAFGAGIAGLAGAIFAAVSTGIAPGAFDVSLLITIYAVVILGGAGSLVGVIVGAIVINVSYEALSPSTPSTGRWLFYVAILVVLALRMRPWAKLGAVVAGTVAFGFAVHAIAGTISASATSGTVTSGGRLTGVIHHWVIIPEHPGKSASYAYVGLVLAVIVLTRLPGWWRTLALVPVLYLTAFVWENLLVEQPAVARLILFGALLIAIMQVRPQGLLGTARVEIV